MMIKEMIKEERVFDSTIELKDNAMLKLRRDLFNEWDFKKNDEVGLDIYKVSKASNKKAWWICPKCHSSYDMSANNRGKDKKCPYCSGRRVNDSNSLAALNPELSAQWHPTLNKELTSHNVTQYSEKRVWWLGECGHEWDTKVGERRRGEGCPFCAGKKIEKGFNDMWTTNPELASMLSEPEDGYKYTQSSRERVNWKCPNCSETINNKAICSINTHGLSCLNCSDYISYPEKFVYNLLRQLDLDFEWQKSFRDSKRRSYDFYLQIYSQIIIETHGMQHYGKGFANVGGRTLEEEMENDKFKYEVAMKNGIEHYIIIDCRVSDYEYIKNNIITSELSKIFNLKNVDWDQININSQKPFNLEILHLWSKGICKKEICKITKVSLSTVKRIIRQCTT